jgi:hypothetical protein
VRPLFADLRQLTTAVSADAVPALLRLVATPYENGAASLTHLALTIRDDYGGGDDTPADAAGVLP